MRWGWVWRDAHRCPEPGLPALRWPIRCIFPPLWLTLLPPHGRQAEAAEKAWEGRPRCHCRHAAAAAGLPQRVWVLCGAMAQGAKQAGNASLREMRLPQHSPKRQLCIGHMHQRHELVAGFRCSHRAA